MEWLQQLRDLSILVAALVAAYGFDSWRREHAWKRRMELAEDVLTQFYEARDAIAEMRGALSFEHETKDVTRFEGEDEEEFRARKSASVVFARYNSHKELFNKIHALRYRFMAQIGRAEAQPFNELHETVREILRAARMLSRLWARRHHPTPEAMKEHHAKVEEYEAIFWEMSPDDDISKKVNTIVTQMEKTCRGLIEGRGTIFGFLNWRVLRSAEKPR